MGGGYRGGVVETRGVSGRDVALTAPAPIAWATTYAITQLWLPPGRPLFSAMVRCLPVGLLLLSWRRRLPTCDWWWKAAVLGILNFGGFFALLFVGAYRLPGGLASTLQATGPLVIMLLAWLLLRERARVAAIAGGALGLVGVAVLVLRAGFVVDAIGVLAALSSVLVTSTGFVLVKRWTPPVDLLTLTAWQLVAGGLFLLPLALLVEGPPPILTPAAIASYTWLALVATLAAYLCWFRGLRLLPAAAVGTLSLLNPLTATLLGVLLVGEVFGPFQGLGTVLVLVGVLLGQPAITDAVRAAWSKRRDPSA